MNFYDGIKELFNHSLTIATGEELFYKRSIKDRLKNKHKEIIYLDCKEDSDREIISFIESRDLFSSERLIIIRNFINMDIIFIMDIKLIVQIQTKFVILCKERKSRCNINPKLA